MNGSLLPILRPQIREYPANTLQLELSAKFVDDRLVRIVEKRDSRLRRFLRRFVDRRNDRLYAERHVGKRLVATEQNADALIRATAPEVEIARHNILIFDRYIVDMPKFLKEKFLPQNKLRKNSSNLTIECERWRSTFCAYASRIRLMIAGAVQIEATIHILKRLSHLCAFAVQFGQLSYVCVK